MKQGLLAVERMVLESMGRNLSCPYEISFDTGLELSLVGNILRHLNEHGVIDLKNDLYFINKERMKEWKETINTSESVKEEVKDLFVSLVNKYFSQEKQATQTEALGLRKIWLTPKEEKIFNSLIYNLESFVEGIQKERSKTGINQKLQDQKVIFWGHSKYNNLVQGTLAV